VVSHLVKRLRAIAIWIGFILVTVVPVIAAMMSPLLEWRNPIYIVAGFGGVIALCLLFLQPMLASGFFPGISLLRQRRIHRYVGSALVIAVLVHLVGLWITSPPDVVDALLFVSATSFSIWGVIAMWSVFITALLVVFRRRFGLSVRRWRITHWCLAAITVTGSIVHTLMIDGTMELISKIVLCACVVVAIAYVLYKSTRRLP